MRRANASGKFRLQPADAFDLIRWLARTQSDPRKAIAELVQNSIDARARAVTITRRRLRGVPALVVRDDGEGVLPHLGRDEALRYLGTNIGHSHKLGLSPSERHARVIAGQYGVGLLGFWAIGARMEIRSRVAGSDVHVLALREEQQTAQLSRMPHELDAPPTYTELVIYELHEAAERPLSGRRLADYLAAELRGPILASGVAIEVRDHMARGLAQKQFTVTPRRYEGIRIDVPEELDVLGHPPARIELYLSRGAERPAIQLACAGTLVGDDLGDVAALELDGEPWRGCELTGVVEFPAFQVPPGTRRGVVPNAAASAFAAAMRGLAPLVRAELARLEQRRRVEADRHLVDDLRKALRGLRERMPHYDLPIIDRGASAGDARASAGAELPGADAERDAPAPLDDADADDASPQAALFPPGPVAAVAIVPSVIAVPIGGQRRIHARAVDADGRVVRDGLAYTWRLHGDGFTLDGVGPRPAIACGHGMPGAEGRVELEVRQGDAVTAASARVVTVERKGRDTSGAGDGIPRPELVDEPGATWRSRMSGSAWQVNAAHEDYLALEDGRARIRYLVALLGKEIVARTYQQPGASELLEHLIAVMAHAERNLRGPSR
jgi:hypothetical protein